MMKSPANAGLFLLRKTKFAESRIRIEMNTTF